MRDHRGRSPDPRRLGEVVGNFRDSIAPPTLMAAVETAWESAVGEKIAAVARPVSERGGVITIECESSVWAEELSLMERRLRLRLAEEIDGEGPSKLRFRAI